MLDPLERVRACLLNAHLDGAFYVRRAEGGIRVDLRWESRARDVAEALRGAGFSVERLEAGAALVKMPETA